MKLVSILALAIFAGVFSVGRAAAASIAIANSSFETSGGVALAPGGWNNELGPEWRGTNGTNHGNAFIEYIAGFASEGTQHLGMAQGYSVWQVLGVNYEPNTIYTLNVAVGNRNPSFTVAGNESTYSLADDTGVKFATASLNASTLAQLTFADAPPLVLNTAATPDAVGKPIRIQFDALGVNRSHFDNVRLDASPVPEPTAAGLLALSALGLIVRRRR